ncbi:hypothetical protein P9112_008747 [Eukaryota sp. TZLM1-RC]
MFECFRGLHRNVYISAATSFFAEMSIRMVFDLVPLFLYSVIYTPPFLVAFTENITDSLAHVLKLVFGRMADSSGRKLLTGLGYLLGLIPRPLLFNVKNWWVVFLAKLTERVGKGMRTAPRDALLADSTNPQQRSVAYGLQRACDMIGGLLGMGFILISLIVLKSPTSLNRSLFNWFCLISLIPASIAVLIWFLGITEDFQPVASTGNGLVEDISTLGSKFYQIVFVTSFFSIGFLGNSFNLMLVKDLDIELEVILTLLLFSRLIGSIGGTSLPYVVDRFGVKQANLLGYLSHSIACLLFVLGHHTRNLPIFFIAFGIFGYSISIHRTSAKTLTSLIVPSRHQGLALGGLFAMIGFGTSVGAIITGWLYSLKSTYPFFYGAIFGILSMILLTFIYKDERFQPRFQDQLLEGDND